MEDRVPRTAPNACSMCCERSARDLFVTPGSRFTVGGDLLCGRDAMRFILGGGEMAPRTVAA